MLRDRRMQRLRETGLLADAVKECERDPEELAWEDAENKAWEARRMEVYAAQIHRMDQGIGDILATLEQTVQLQNTLVFFLSDNGACAEVLPLDGSAETFIKRRPDLERLKPRNGRDLQVGNEPSIVPGPEDTYASYGRAWANLSNTPFRLYKRWTHEGGIATPLIVHWPAGELNKGAIVRTPSQLTDVLPTILEAAQVLYPENYRNRHIPKSEGHSLLSALRGDKTTEHPLFWEHTGNAAIRQGRWKLVCEYPKLWELYDMDNDRAEKINLAGSYPDIVRGLVAQWEAWANRVGVVPWDTVLAGYRTEGKNETEAAG